MEEERGVAISTLGKVIARGWDWLGLAPGDADRISGLIEAPPLVEALTLNKADFVRTGSRGSVYHAYRKALQEVVGNQLETWGNGAQPPRARPRRTRALERDLQSVLADLTDDYPILSTLVDRTPGGQRRLPFGRSDGTFGGAPLPDTTTAGGDRNDVSPRIDPDAAGGDEHGPSVRRGALRWSDPGGLSMLRNCRNFRFLNGGWG